MRPVCSVRPRHLLTAAAVTMAVIATATALAGSASAGSASAGSASVEPVSLESAFAGPRPPVCGKVSDRDFPIETRIHDGPAAYRPGGGAGIFSLDLTNTTGTACRDIHPVLVLFDRDRALSVADITLETADGEGRWRALTLEKSDEDEIIGVLDDGSPGFAVPPGRTVTVRVRLAFAAGTPPDEIVVNAATVQRPGGRGDGEWVGASNDYLFAVREPPRSGTGTGAVGVGSRTDSDASDASDAELATTGPGGGPGLLGRAVAVAALLMAGASLVIGLRRLRTRRN
ncbi:hypothetical protein ACIOWG_12470 [Streptomyces sp. NPDC087658]|uniref:hypothetical protein n=1 Tax=Streptomyces sp. NPDC087658 TaxID=3365800 RepID=UPI0037F2F2CC